MENLGDILSGLATTRRTPEGGPPVVPPEDDGGDKPCPLCRGRGWFTLDVPTGHPEFGRIITCQCQQERILQEQEDRLLRYSNLGHLSRFTFDTLDREGRTEDQDNRRLFSAACEAAQVFAEHPEGWLVLTGPHGSGKTHLAAAIANRRIQLGRIVFFVHVADLLDHLRAAFGPTSEVSYTDLFEQVRNTPLLVLDGLGAHTATPWAEEKLHQIVNHRFNAELPTVATTTMDLDRLDPYIRSRLEADAASRVLPVRGPAADRSRYQGQIEPEMLRRMTFKSFDRRGNQAPAAQQASLEAAYRAAKNFAADPVGWLTFFGETGVGKTHLAVAIAGECMSRGRSVFFAFVPELLDYMRYTFNPESRVTYDRILDEIKNAPLLVLDDLGRERSSPWAEEKLYQIVVHRHDRRLPTVVTSSRDFTKESGPISSRVQDPFVGSLVRLDAPDYRIRIRGNRSRGRPRRTTNSG